MSSREIKFRAWDPDKQAMCDVWNISFKAWDEGEINDLTLHAGAASDHGTYEPDRVHKVVLMQYTGLKDSQGREIYEGDIVATTIHESGMGDRTEVLKIVAFMEDGVWSVSPVFLSLNCYPCAEDILVKVKYQVIVGNIHENPELLKS